MDSFESGERLRLGEWGRQRPRRLVEEALIPLQMPPPLRPQANNQAAKRQAKRVAPRKQRQNSRAAMAVRGTLPRRSSKAAMQLWRMEEERERGVTTGRLRRPPRR